MSAKCQKQTSPPVIRKFHLGHLGALAEIRWPCVIPAVDTLFKGPCLFPREQRPTPVSIIQSAPAGDGRDAAPQNVPSPDFGPDNSIEGELMRSLALNKQLEPLD